MTLFAFVFLYVMNGQVVFEKANYPTLEQCMKEGQARIEAIELKPSYVGGLFANCVELPGQVVKK